MIALAEELELAGSADDALEAFQDRRFDRCKDIVDTSIAVGKMQLDGGNPQQVGGMIGGGLHRLAAPY